MVFVLLVACQNEWHFLEKEGVLMQPEQPMTLKDWIITLILLFIPIVGLVMLIIWVVDKEDPRNKFALAYLIVSVGIFVLIFAIYFLIIVFILFLTFIIGTTV